MFWRSRGARPQAAAPSRSLAWERLIDDRLHLLQEHLGIQEVVRIRLPQRIDWTGGNEHRFDGIASPRPLFDLGVVSGSLVKSGDRVWPDRHSPPFRIKHYQVVRRPFPPLTSDSLCRDREASELFQHTELSLGACDVQEHLFAARFFETRNGRGPFRDRQRRVDQFRSSAE